MDERVMQFRVGVMVLASVIIAVILIVMFGEAPRLFQTQHTVEVFFQDAPGVTASTPIRKSGILVGRVLDVRFAEDEAPDLQRRGVIVTARLDRPLHDDETFSIRSKLLGDAIIHVVRSEKPVRAADTPWLIGHRTPEPTEAIPELTDILRQTGESVSAAAQSLAQASDHMGVAAQTVTGTLRNNEEALADAIRQAGETLATLDRVARAADNIIGDEQTQQQFKSGIQRLGRILENAETTMVLVDTNLRNLEKFTGPLSQNAEQRVARIDHAIDQLDGLMQHMQGFAANLTNDQGTLGRLVNDPELYEHLNRAANNVEQLTRQLQPIVADVRVFTDKIARHPGIIVRDAVRPGAGLK